MEQDQLTCWTKGWQRGESYNITQDQWTCESVFNFCDCPMILEADPDIAGIGVIVSFIACTVISLVLTIGLQFSASCHPRSWTTPRNPLDQVAFNLAGLVLPKMVVKRHALKTINICYDMVICLSDQQLATGVGVLIAGLKKLYDGTISIYHFRIVMHLAAITSSGYRFSIVAFFAWREIKERDPALSTPQRELFKGKIARILRVVLLVVLDVLYLYCCWATRDSLWENRPHCPAQCVLSSPRSAENSIGAIGDTFFTCFSYCVGIIAVKNILQNKRARRVHRGINYYVNGLGSSRVFGLAIHLTLYIYSMWKIMNDLNGGHTVMLEQGQQEALESEYSMSFGQIVPIFLLILPIIQLLESLSVHSNSEVILGQDTSYKSNPRPSTSGINRITTW